MDEIDSLYNYDWKTFTQLNRIRFRTNHGRSNYTLNKWNPMTNPMFDGDHPEQTIHHIANDCVNSKFDGGNFHQFFTKICFAVLCYIIKASKDCRKLEDELIHPS